MPSRQGENSKAKKLQADFDAVMALPAEQLQMFIERLSVHANLPGLMGITEELKRRLRHHGFHDSKLDLAVEQLYGWLWHTLITSLERVLYLQQPKGSRGVL